MKRTILFMLFTLLSLQVFGQHTVTGTVKDEDGEILPGATVLIKGTTQGAVTDIDGKYSVKVPDGDAILIFSFVGYIPQEAKVRDRKTVKSVIDIVLEASYIEYGYGTVLKFEPIVITALGLESTKSSLGYSLEEIKSKDLTEVKSANFVQSLAGKVAGVTITQGATGIGSTSKITIRGEASFTNNNPLFVVDGTPINNNTVFNFTNEAAAGFQEVDFGNGAMEVNPDDIESVSVLKGPSAAALYGTRASNGVILITTKSGKNKKGLGISYNTSISMETPFQLPEFQNSYGQGNSGNFAFVDGLGGGTNDNITYSWGPRLDQGTLIPQFNSPVTLPDGTVVRGGDVAVHGGLPITATPFVSNPDNLKNFYQTGYTLTNNLALAGSYDKGNYRLSITDMRNESIIPGVNLDRSTVNARLQFNPTSKLTANTSISYVNSKSDNRPANGYGSENVNYSLVAWGPRSLNISDLENYWQPGLEGIQQYAFNYTFFDNPYFILHENKNAFNRNRIFGNISLKYQIDEHFSIQARTGLDVSNEERTFRRNFSSNRFRNGAYAEQSISYREQNTDILVNYSNEWNHFDVDFSVGANRLDQSAKSVQLQTVALAQPGIFSLANAASPIASFPRESEKRINSIYSVAKLGYKGFLFLEFTGRNDWSSALATPQSAGNSSFFYPSASSSFVLSEVVDLPEIISFAKFRASWAQVGNDTDPYQTSTAFVAQVPFNSQPTFSGQNFIANNNLRPEITTSVEFGGDFRFLDDRIQLDVTYYNALTKDQIIALPTPIASGFSQRVVNGGEVRSKGVEILARITPIATSEVTWRTAFNFSRNITTIETLPSEITGRLTLGYSRVYDNENQTVWVQAAQGGRVGDLYGTGYLRNENGDFVIGTDGRFVVDNTLKKLGNSNPDFVLGWSNQIKYKNWDMSFLFDWRQGGVLVSRTLALAAVGGQLKETENRPDAGIVAAGVVNTGTTDSPVWVANTTPIPAETYYRQFYDRNHEENNTYDASYLKMREFSIAYTFENRGLFTEGRSLRISLFGRNLFALSEIPHFDPEQLAVQGTGFVGGVEDMSYATSRSLGLKFSFQF